MSGVDDKLDSQLARLGARVAARSESTRDQLEALGAIELAEAARATFQARLVYLGPDSGFPHGQTYNFDLRGHANAPIGSVHGYTPSAPERPSDLPYRGRANQGKRKARKPPTPDQSRDPKPTWHDLYRDR